MNQLHNSTARLCISRPQLLVIQSGDRTGAAHHGEPAGPIGTGLA